MKQVRLALVFAAIMLGTAFIMTHTEQLGLPLLAEERLNGVMIGFILMWFGNLMPKQGPDASCAQCGASDAQSMRRFAGWVFVLAGLVHSGLWLFAPLEQANLLAMLTVAAAMIVVIGRATLTRAWV